MNIFPVGNSNNLYRVTDVFPQEIIDFCNSANWNDYLWVTQQGQETLPRLLLNLNSCFPLTILKKISCDIAMELQEKLNLKFTNPNKVLISVWRDLHGYAAPIHRDFDEVEVKKNGYFNIPISMQIYLSESNADLGTKFYYDREKTMPKYFFPYEINTGYLQINDYDQWHEMNSDIPVDENRISCHFIFSNLVK
jgi:hypothetical protein